MHRFLMSPIALLGVWSAAWSAPICKEVDGRHVPSIALREVARGLEQPVHIAVFPGQADRLVVVEQGGTIRIIEHGQARAKPFLDIREQVDSGGEKGLLSIAFHPRFVRNGEFFVNYTSSDRGRLHTRISRFRAGPRQIASPESEQVLLRIEQPYSNHNGGQLAFGPDGYLYIGMGDGGSANDPGRHAQNPASLLGKLLRIDVDGREAGRAYRIPPDNPFKNETSYRPEIWALGLRNPWRFSFDVATGALWLADVGQDRIEEIDVVRKGGNYGWPAIEGNECNPAVEKNCRPDLFDPPVHTYRHPQGFSITGGHVYRGAAIPGLCGAYVYADYVTRRLWALPVRGQRARQEIELIRKAVAVSSFGQDPDGEIYVADHRNGRILKIVPRQ